MVTMQLSSGRYALLLVACVCVCVSAYSVQRQKNKWTGIRENVRVERSATAATLAAAVIGPMVTGVLNDHIRNGFHNIDAGTEFFPITGIISQNFPEVMGAYQLMDQNLQRTVSMIAKQISNLPTNRQHNWQDIVDMFSNSPILRVVNGSNVHRVKQLNLGSRTHLLKCDGSPEEGVITRVNDWFRNTLVIDPDVLAATRISDAEFRKLAIVVAHPHEVSLATLFRRYTYVTHTKTIIDINVIRFPDILQEPHLKLYRIKLTATSTCVGPIFIRVDENKVNGSFNSLKFIARPSIGGLPEHLAVNNSLHV